jgi:hypothetical protein
MALGVAAAATEVEGAGPDGIPVHADANATITARTSREKTSAIGNGAGR